MHEKTRTMVFRNGVWFPLHTDKIFADVGKHPAFRSLRNRAKPGVPFSYNNKMFKTEEIK